LAGFFVCTESAYYVNDYIPYQMHQKFTWQVAVGDDLVESSCQAATRCKSWEAQGQM